MALLRSKEQAESLSREILRQIQNEQAFQEEQRDLIQSLRETRTSLVPRLFSTRKATGTIPEKTPHHRMVDLED